MAKQSGLGDNFYVGGYDLSGDVQAVNNVSGGNTPLDVTSIDKSAMERIGGLRDGSIGFTSFFDDAVGASHPTLSALPTADVIASYLRGTAIGSPVASCVAKQIDYAGTRGTDGAFTLNTDAQANGYGISWGRQLTAGLRTDTSGTNGSSLDGAASSSFGWHAFLHVTGITGTSVTCTLQDSADNSSWSNVTGGAFTAASAVGAQRIASASGATLRRYTRIVSSGTFSSATFAVNLVRHESTVTW